MDFLGQEGFTALNYAIKFCHDEVAEYLIRKGASLDIADDVFHQTAMDLIVKKIK